MSRDLRVHRDDAIPLLSAAAWFCVEIETSAQAAGVETVCRFATALASDVAVEELLEYHRTWYAVRMKRPATLAQVDEVVQRAWAAACERAEEAETGT